MDWSYALLTDTERILFRRLAVFVGSFDLTAASEVAAAGGDDFVERYSVLDQLTLLVDKSLVVAEESRGSTRYRLLETVRQYALEKLNESEEIDGVRARHRTHYATMAAGLNVPASTDYEQRLLQAEAEIDNLRAAFTWSRGNGDIAAALQLASALQPLWSQGRMREGLAWLESILEREGDNHLVPAGVWARALAEKVILKAWPATSPMGAPTSSRRLTMPWRWHATQATAQCWLERSSHVAAAVVATRKPLNPTSPRRSSWRAPLTMSGH